MKYFNSIFFILWIGIQFSQGQNVGIGNSDPLKKLHVTGDDIRVESPTARVEFYSGPTANRGYVGWNSGMYLWNNDNTPIIFGTTATERVRIGASGNVGIGVSTIGAKLDILASGDETSPILKFRQSNVSNYGIEFGIDNNVHGGLHIRRDNNGTVEDAMVIRRDNGNVGIGVSAPNFLLSLGTTSPTIHFWDTDQTSYFQHVNSNIFYLLFDSDNNGSWDGNHPMQIHALNRDNAGIGTMVFVSGKMQLKATSPSFLTANAAQLELSNAASGPAFISFHREGAYGAHFGLDTDNWFSTQGWSAGTGYTNLRAGTINATGGYQFDGKSVIYNNNNDVYGNFRVLTNNSTTLQDGMYINYSSSGTSHLRLFAGGTNQRMFINANNGNVSIDNLAGNGTVPLLVNNSGILTAGTSIGYSGESCRNQGQADINLGSTADRFCYLTYVTGKFEGGGEIIRIYESGGNWFLGINSGQSGVRGCARCFVFK